MQTEEIILEKCPTTWLSPHESLRFARKKEHDVQNGTRPIEVELTFPAFLKMTKKNCLNRSRLEK